MPTFSTITLDRLLEPAMSKTSKTQSVPVKPPICSKKIDSDMEKKVFCQVKASPLLYTTPESTPLPDDQPVSFAPSPFIVNHKRRGPRLLKSFSQGDVGGLEEKKVGESGNGNGKVVELCGGEEVVGGEEVDVEVEGEGEREVDDLSMSVAVSSERDYVEEDFFDPQEAMSVSSSVEVEENTGGELTVRVCTPSATAEFYDAYEELLSDGSSQSSLRDIESELREIRLSLLMELERRKRAEESLDNVRRHWERLRQQLSVVGLTLPPASTIEMEDENRDIDPAEDLCQQIHLARAISTSVGRGAAKAEAEMELESQLESKNFEIARISDRLHYYESMNHEMSQRNQEATEMARRHRQKRKQRQRWIWSSIGASVVLGSVALAWSYLPSESGLDHNNSSHSPGADETAQ